MVECSFYTGKVNGSNPLLLKIILMVFSSEIIIYSVSSINGNQSFFNVKNVPKRIHKISVNKSPFVFKKSKERFIYTQPIKSY